MNEVSEMIDRQMKLYSVIAIALFASLFLYGYIAFTISLNHDLDFELVMTKFADPDLGVLIVVAVMNLAIAVVLPLILKRVAVQGAADQEKIMNELASVPLARGAVAQTQIWQRGQLTLPDLVRISMLNRYGVITIVALAASESLTLIGLAAALVTHTAAMVIPFAIVSAGLFAFHWPSRTKFDDLVNQKLGQGRPF